MATYYSQDVTLGDTETVTSSYDRANRDSTAIGLLKNRSDGWRVDQDGLLSDPAPVSVYGSSWDGNTITVTVTPPGQAGSTVTLTFTESETQWARIPRGSTVAVTDDGTGSPTDDLVLTIGHDLS
jgi:hypothetical protein